MVIGIYCVVDCLIGVGCGVEEFCLFVLFGFIFIFLLEECLCLFVEILRFVGVKEFVGIIGVVCFVFKMLVVGLVDVEIFYGVLIWLMGNYILLLLLIVVKGFLVCIRVWFVKFDELVIKVVNFDVFDFSKDIDVCFIILFECIIFFVLVLIIGRINVGEIVSEEIVFSFFIFIVVVF